MVNITVGSRKSQLALTQSNWIMNELKQVQPNVTFDLKHVVTKGDQILDVTLSKVGGKGLFVKEIEQALITKDIDFAVHSMKDMPAELPEGLIIACVPIRADHRDALISKNHVPLTSLKEGAVVGTSSLRRAAQILARRPDLQVKSIRGNIDTRLRKLDEEDYDAIILAAAGLARMGWSSDIVTEYLSDELSVPAVGQGALAIECRADDQTIIDFLKPIHDEYTYKTVMAERAFLHQLEGGCQVPIAAYCVMDDKGVLSLTGLVGSPDGKIILKEHLTGTDSIELGQRLANILIDQGAKKIVDDVKEANDQ